MSKELEALERIKHTSIVVEKGDKIKPILPYVNNELKIIETALKEKENIENSINELFSENGKVITTIEIKKKLKALEKKGMEIK